MSVGGREGSCYSSWAWLPARRAWPAGGWGSVRVSVPSADNWGIQDGHPNESGGQARLCGGHTRDKCWGDSGRVCDVRTLGRSLGQVTLKKMLLGRWVRNLRSPVTSLSASLDMPASAGRGWRGHLLCPSVPEPWGQEAECVSWYGLRGLAVALSGKEYSGAITRRVSSLSERERDDSRPFSLFFKWAV